MAVKVAGAFLQLPVHLGAKGSVLNCVSGFAVSSIRRPRHGTEGWVLTSVSAFSRRPPLDDRGVVIVRPAVRRREAETSRPCIVLVPPGGF